VSDGGRGRHDVVVEIADDGRGFDATTTPGRGLQHMRQRAGAIGAALEIDGTPAGTCVRLRLPELLRTGAGA
jgi:signal transduction histidine kinase